MIATGLNNQFTVIRIRLFDGSRRRLARMCCQRFRVLTIDSDAALIVQHHRSIIGRRSPYHGARWNAINGTQPTISQLGREKRFLNEHHFIITFINE